MTQEDKLFVFIIWEKARSFEARILDDLSTRFKIVQSYEMSWPKRNFTGNLAAFYGWKSKFCWWNKVRKCGWGPFRVVVVEDPKPVWTDGYDTSGHHLTLNENVDHAKKAYRAMTGHSNRIHASVTTAETAHQLRILSMPPESPIPFTPFSYEADKEPISITYSATDSWAQHLAVAMTSVILNNPGERFTFHVLHHDMTPATQMRLAQIERDHPNVRLVFHAVDESRFADFPTPKCLSEIPFMACFRLMLPEILPDESRTIYSDIDVLAVRGGVRGLWKTDLKGHPVACVSDHHIDSYDFRLFRKMLGMHPGDDYFCSGLIVMDLDTLRRLDFVKKCFEAARRHRDILVYVDQDILNSVCAGDILPLSDKWNCGARWNPFRTDVVQWHFQSQTSKPWCNIWKNVTWLPYLRFLLKTPYRARALRFVLGHVTGLFWFSYTKNCVRRYLFCGIRVWKRKV